MAETRKAGADRAGSMAISKGVAARAMATAITALVASFVPAAAADILSARFTDPTTRYAHAVLGDDVEWGGLELTLTSGETRSFILPKTHVFEDLQPRLVDLDNDKASEIIVVESSQTQGARLAIYDEDGFVIATPYIGRSFRWLAPVGAADLDQDGLVEIAYVDRPHLAKTLRIWRYQDRNLYELAQFAGVTNHRIGEDFISGGIRTCDGEAEMIVADAAWRNILSVTFDGQSTQATAISAFSGRQSFAAALHCP